MRELGELQRRQIVVVRLARRAVDDLVKHAHADEIVVEVDIEPRQPLRRLVGEQEGRHEGDEFAGRRAGLDHPIAAIDRSERDGEAAEHFHDRAGAIGDARHLVRFVLYRGHAVVEPPPHLVLEAEGLDHAHALQRFLHGLDDAGAAVELHAGDAAHAADDLAQKVEGRRRANEAEQRHRRILNHHHDAKSDQRHQIAADRGDQQIDHAADGVGAGGEPGDEFGGMPVGKEADIFRKAACRTDAADCRR